MTLSEDRPGSQSTKTSLKNHKGGTGCHTGSSHSFVDESLFGTCQKPAKNSKARGTHPPSHDITTLTRSQIRKMLEPSPILTLQEIAQLKSEKEQKLRETRGKTQKRKETMIKMEEDRRKHTQKSETEVLQQEEDKATISRAKHLFEEELDDVKNMNQMMLYSKCVTIRDAQIEEKKHMMLETEEENRQLDLMMEIERLRALDNYEATEVRRAEERRRGAAVLLKQIEEGSKERAKQEEMIHQDRTNMLKEIERLKEEEAQVHAKKKESAAQIMKEVALANAEQIQRKEVMKAQEKEEDARIAAYLREKDIREQAAIEEKARIALEKELEVGRLRALQEKAADKQAEIDELRARRYQEAKEREWREKELAAKEHQTSIMKDLSKAREAQKAAKIRQLADMARVEHQEFQRVLQANRCKEQEELAQAQSQTLANLQYKEDLLAQVAANDHMRSKLNQEQLEEGKKLLQTIGEEAARLEHIKKKKLAELERAGVPAKYRAELHKKRVGGW